MCALGAGFIIEPSEFEGSTWATVTVAEWNFEENLQRFVRCLKRKVGSIQSKWFQQDWATQQSTIVGCSWKQIDVKQTDLLWSPSIPRTWVHWISYCGGRWRIMSMRNENITQTLGDLKADIKRTIQGASVKMSQRAIGNFAKRVEPYGTKRPALL